jgi:hypothetical protein
MSRIISKTCRYRRCGRPFEQPALQAMRPTEYCSVACNHEERRERNAAAMRRAYQRKKALGYKPEERIESLDFGA